MSKQRQQKATMKHNRKPFVPKTSPYSSDKEVKETKMNIVSRKAPAIKIAEVEANLGYIFNGHQPWYNSITSNVPLFIAESKTSENSTVLQWLGKSDTFCGHQIGAKNSIFKNLRPTKWKKTKPLVRWNILGPIIISDWTPQLEIDDDIIVTGHSQKAPRDFFRLNLQTFPINYLLYYLGYIFEGNISFVNQQFKVTMITEQNTFVPALNPDNICGFLIG